MTLSKWFTKKFNREFSLEEGSRIQIRLLRTALILMELRAGAQMEEDQLEVIIPLIRITLILVLVGVIKLWILGMAKEMEETQKSIPFLI